MASLLKSKLSSKNQNLNPRVQPHSCDPTLAWDRLKVKQVVKRLALVCSSSCAFISTVPHHTNNNV